METGRYLWLKKIKRVKQQCGRNFLLLFVVFLVVACSFTAAPEDVALKFLDATAEFRFEEAKEYCDEDTAKFLDLAAGYIKMSNEQPESLDFFITETEIDGDKASVSYTTSKSTDEQTVYLRKVEGDWKVSMGKENLEKEQ